MWPVFEAYKEIAVRIPIDLRENYSLLSIQCQDFVAIS
jgi:hypothetical protein